MACDMLELCKFPSLNICQKKFLWAHKEVDLALHPVVGVVLQVGNAEKFPQALGFERLDPFFGVNKQGPCFTAMLEFITLYLLACQVMVQKAIQVCCYVSCCTSVERCN